MPIKASADKIKREVELFGKVYLKLFLRILKTLKRKHRKTIMQRMKRMLIQKSQNTESKF